MRLDAPHPLCKQSHSLKKHGRVGDMGACGKKRNPISQGVEGVKDPEGKKFKRYVKGVPTLDHQNKTIGKKPYRGRRKYGIMLYGHHKGKRTNPDTIKTAESKLGIWSTHISADSGSGQSGPHRDSWSIGSMAPADRRIEIKRAWEKDKARSRRPSNKNTT